MLIAVEEWHAVIPHYRIATDEPLHERGGQLALLSLPLAWDVDKERHRMKLTIDAAMCTGHGRCYTLAPDLLSYDDEGFVDRARHDRSTCRPARRTPLARPR